MLSVPAITPVTTPPKTVALLLAVLHVPPLAVSLKVIIEPKQTLVAPVIVPATGNGLTVITYIATAVPQLLVTVYCMVSTPQDIPVTTPLETLAFALVVLHIPPLATSLNRVFAPTQTLVAPVIVSAIGSGLIVIT